MKIVAISDIHGDLIKIPECDVLCICGDILPLDVQRKESDSCMWILNEFIPWVDSLPCEHVVFIAGNHDFAFEPKQNKEVNITEFWRGNNKIHYLLDESIEIDGKVFYGTPWCPVLYRWAFYQPPSGLDMKFSNIPDCDVLLTHCPPDIGNAGTVLQECWNYGNNFGCKELRNHIDNKNIQWVISGHIHSGEHDPVKYFNGNCEVNVVNVSVKDEHYDVAYQPFKFEI